MYGVAALTSASSSDFETDGSEDVFLTPGISSPVESEHPDENPAPEDEAQDGEAQDDAALIQARAYQLEMFEESLKRNIIVAMDTGTGKTQVAVLRIKAELDKSPPEKIVWFLAPTVALCVQQLEVLKTQIRSVQMKLLSGADGCDTWSEPHIWDDFLLNVRVVVSTHQVLYDAVAHAFVRLNRLSLIVFDEAHRCFGKHPGSKIMTLYHEDKRAGLPVPAILGLTATPIMKSKVDDLEVIERTLDAICRSPSVHRDQLISMVKRPEMLCRLYMPERPSITYTKSMRSLITTAKEFDIFSDPEIIRLSAENTERSRAALQKALEKGTTKTSKQIQSLGRKALEVWKELGGWACDWFIYTAITQFLDSVEKNDLWFETWKSIEKQYLASILQKVEINDTPEGEVTQTSDKVKVLVRELLSSPEGTTGIIFACQTATVAVLAHVLSILPSTRSRFRVGSMFGTSRVRTRKRNVGELYQEDDYKHLTQFQNGELNLLVATDVLEEGIDVPACNLVVCFDPPTNLKSFIQRRGRARAQESRLVMIIPEESDKHLEWEQLEIEMKEKYEDQLREIEHLATLENDESQDIPPFRVASTGAQLDFDHAKSHLQHVCTALTSRQYVDSRPFYLKRETQVSHRGPPMIKSTVVLSIAFPPHLRRFEGARVWYSEKNATKDAAFQAFTALYAAGLVNDHLMPLKQELEGVEVRAASIGASELWNPWPRIARAWNETTTVNMRQLRLVDQNGQVVLEFDASLPDSFLDIPDFNLYWDKSNTFKIKVGELKTVAKSDLKPDQSMALIDLACGYRWEVYNLPHVLHLQSSQDIPFHDAVGERAIEEGTLEKGVLVRFDGDTPYFYESWLPSMPSLDLVQRKPPKFLEELADAPWLALKGWPKRQDFLHPANEDRHAAPSTKSYNRIRPASCCRVDSIPASVAQFGAFVPTIMHIIENHMIADELRKTILLDLDISDLSLVVTAISSSAAHEQTNYQRLEFLGDSILKLLTSTNVAANHQYYPEGYLSAKKNQVVSNSRLCRAAIETGLDKFILTKAFTRSKWRPLYIEDQLRLDPEALGERDISTKTLADVVESLIGASFLDGGIDKALHCIQLFIPEVEWHTLTTARDMLAAQKPIQDELPSTLLPLEGLIGYTFRNKTLAVEAMTHSSYNLGERIETCMERLEFIGDAVLDDIIVSVLWDYHRAGRGRGREYTHYEMHLFRAACVNGDLLGFLMMEWTFPQETTDVVTSFSDNNQYNKNSSSATTTTTEVINIPIWRLMRHSSQRLSGAQSLTEEKHVLERDAILSAMHNISNSNSKPDSGSDHDYPWALLAHLQIPKSFADLFESILGAVWVDSGDMQACKMIAERAGILPYLRRLLDAGVNGLEVAHPKNKLGELVGKGGGRKGVDYVTDLRWGEGESGTKEWTCKVFVGGELLVEVGEGVNREEIVTKAADVAYKLLKRGGDRGASVGGGGGEDGDVVMT